MDGREMPLFAYGSLMENLFNYQKYLDGKVKGRPKKARIKGKLFHMKEKHYPALLPGADWVYGEIFELSDFQTDISSVDQLENYFGVNDERNEYERQIVEVEVFDEKTKRYSRTEKVYCYLYVTENDLRFDHHSIYLQEGNWRNYHEQVAN
ncbi:gamma-glutamylcyclotransferase [Enterococcus sp. BWM-S5]|uniref:Gamma-glutamylcyclotransferase n=1 Tax=Enterococcus larvae TaxID=2794352 RepID=A0ABS4CLS6_9ENTE|nr:gamma-glutamylcyclotransferase family protein [Enterococcus larvae]MBP1047550.1 gamma-glutamylcyclotransferase [Enterococcus larvae]